MDNSNLAHALHTSAMATIQTPEDLREINRKIEQRRDEIEQQKQKATTSHQVSAL
jgi:hypothetical protein